MVGVPHGIDYWIWLVLPFVGGLLSAIFFECVYKKYIEKYGSFMGIDEYGNELYEDSIMYEESDM